MGGRRRATEAQSGGSGEKMEVLFGRGRNSFSAEGPSSAFYPGDESRGTLTHTDPG